MADFDDDSPAVEMGSGPAPRRRPIAADFDDEDEAPGGQQPAPVSRPPMKGGWGDSGGASAAPQNVSAGVAVESGAVSSNLDDGGAPAAAAASEPPKGGFGRRQAGRGGRDKYDTDTITDITEIPDVEEEPREADLSTVVADAPNVRAQRVQGLQELQGQSGLFQLPSALGDGIDLSLLQSALSPPEHVEEGDALWEFEQLFADVSSEMMAEQAAQEGDSKEGEDLDEEDDNQGVAKGDGKKAALRDRSNRPVQKAAQ